MVGHPWNSSECLALGSSPELPSDGLQAVDARLDTGSQGGLVTVRAADQATAKALLRHIERRLQQQRRALLFINCAVVDSCWREVAQRLGLSPLSGEPERAAQQIESAPAQAVLVLAGSVLPGSWDEQVLQEMGKAQGARLVLLVQVHASPQPEPRAFGQLLQVQPFAQTNIALWWNGLLDQALQQFQGRSLAELEAWWSWSARLVSKGQVPSKACLSPQAEQLLLQLRAAGRAWPQAQLGRLQNAQALSELVESESVHCQQGLIQVLDSEGLGELSPSVTQQLAQALEQVFSQDPFAWARAGLLYMQAQEAESAERCLVRALHALETPAARSPIWQMWRQALDGLAGALRSKSALRAAQLALELEDIEVALDLAQSAASSLSQADYQTALVLGRAQLCRSDLVSAQVSLDRALSIATTEAEKAEVLVQQAETSYLAGKLPQAEEQAHQVLELTALPAVRLQARNTLGKILLAGSQWDEAEAHFASDECDAACAGLDTARLRARLNRAVALLSKGRIDAAQVILESVLAEAQKRQDLRATAFALSNLAVLAIERHDYVQGLALSEQAINTRRRLGDKAGLARVITNLAELRLHLGLLAQAEQALLFGRQGLSAAMAPARAAHFALVTARLRLAQGRTLEAARELQTAITNAGGSSNGAILGECYRLSARVALEDGDTLRAQTAIQNALQHTDSASAQAEVALLEALLSQACGQPDFHQARHALELARTSKDDELLRECHLLICQMARAEGDLPLARQHLQAALNLRDQVANSLTDALRTSYLQRPDLVLLASTAEALSRLEAQQAQSRSLPPASPVEISEPAELSSAYIGRHSSVIKLLTAVRKVALSTSPVLIHGESGTGKELIAESIHKLSLRRAGPLVKINCAALVESLLLSELFGHEKGAFTGAVARRRGRFELADGGTLFLDEIGDISPRTQVALLRVLQDHTFDRVGGTKPLQSDVRIVCATHRDLKALVAQGIFREDLYYRLCGVTLEVPPLRNRLEDLPLIAAHILGRVAKERHESVRQLSASALHLLEQHPWPGNVRELENVLRAASLFCEQEQIGPEALLEHLPVRPAPPPPMVSSDPVAASDEDEDGAEGGPASGPMLVSSETCRTARVAYDEIRKQGTSLSDLKRTIERDCIERALAETNGNITRAACLLGMKRPRLSQLVKQYGLLENTSEEC